MLVGWGGGVLAWESYCYNIFLYIKRKKDRVHPDLPFTVLCSCHSLYLSICTSSHFLSVSGPVFVHVTLDADGAQLLSCLLQLQIETETELYESELPSAVVLFRAKHAE